VRQKKSYKMATERHYLPTNCCFVFSVRTGAIILAVLGIFGGGMNIISVSYGLAVMAPDIEKYIDQYRSEILEQFGTTTPTPEDQAYLDQLMRQLDFLKDLVPWVFVIQIVYASIQFIVSVCLLFGIVKNKPGLMKPWLIVTMFTLLAGFAVLCMAFVVVAVGTPGGILSALLLFCLTTPFLILGYYFWSVVRAAYLEILNQVSKNNPILPTIFQDGGKKYQRM
jgi:hypothetical protein